MKVQRRDFIRMVLPLAAFGSVRGEDRAAKPFRFGVISDPQYADVAPWGTRFYRNSVSKLGKAVEEMNGMDLEFVVTLGDLIDRDLKSFEVVMPIYAKLKHAHFPVLGNHEFDMKDEDKGKVLGAIGMEAAYYAKRYDGWRFLFLDGTDVSLYRHGANDPATKEAAKVLAGYHQEGRVQAKEYNGAIGGEQLKWIAAEIAAAKEAAERVILFHHFPVFPEAPLNLWNSREIVELLSKHKHVAAFMNGHDHKGNYGNHEGVHYLNFKGMVETEAETAYAVVSCFENKLVIDGYGLEPDRDLAIG